MIKSFTQYMTEADKAIVVAFGRFNPPTIGHEKLLDKVGSVARSVPYRIYPSQSQDAKKNPLSFQEKVKFMRKMFPKHGRQIIMDAGVKNAFQMCSKLYDQGFNKVTMVAGSDRVTEFETILNKYNGKKGTHGFYNFEGGVSVVSAGQRDPDAEGVSGMSASKMRAAANMNDFNSFAKGLPPSYREGKALFNAVRKGMGLKEQTDIRRHVEFDKVSDVREAYVAGEVFNEGDMIVITKTDEVAEIILRGTNYVMVETTGGTKLRKWLSDIELVEAATQDADIKDRKGTQPAKYHTGLAKSTKAKRDAQFKKQSKMADDNPDAYKPAPGDKEAKTKPSKYTKAVDKMMSESAEITVGGYKTKYFHMCGSAIKTMKKHSDVKGAELLTKMQDDYFAMEKKFINNEPSAADKTKAIKMYDIIMQKAKQAGIEKDVKPYMDMHKDSILKGDPKPGFGKVDVSERRSFSSFLEMNEDADKSLAGKAKKSGISVGTLRKVYNRGVAAWKTGHRPGTTPSQWGHARVNAFIVKKKKGNLNHDKDLV